MPDIILPEMISGLPLALVTSSNAPLLLLDGELTVIAASASFGKAFLVDPARAAGTPLAILGTGEWNVPQLIALLKASGSGHAKIDGYEMDLKRAGAGLRHLILNAQRLDYPGAGSVRLILAVTDVTEALLAAKQKDDLLTKNAMMLRELQHRVANSLQIIASVLMQSARRVQSDEARVHLHDAHQRVMSVAEVQKQLSSTGMSDVDLKIYLTDLCRSIGASMIRDAKHIALEVRADHHMAGADLSISLGLITTELVINALKHAFCDDRGGTITVEYRADGASWVLSISDNGVGMPAGRAGVKDGLGTTIVAALAKRLDANVTMAEANPGTTVSITHAAIIAEPANTPEARSA
ncbi:sensor histidine kinase [Sphingomonas sp. MMS24-J13]|uniref:sensor histidine kinase n=1 Tax=Sphingomonas sp. MMS24-J13 TaxID=3238686 RepID=UPI00384B1083